MSSEGRDGTGERGDKTEGQDRKGETFGLSE
jgi:hypothetical protein